MKKYEVVWLDFLHVHVFANQIRIISRNLINSNIHINSLFELSTPNKSNCLKYINVQMIHFLSKDVFWVCQPIIMVQTGMLS